MLPDTFYPEVVAEMAFSLYVQGATFAQIADTIRCDGIRDVSGSLYTAGAVQAMVRQYLAMLRQTDTGWEDDIQTKDLT